MKKVTEFSFSAPKEGKFKSADEPSGKIIPKFQWKNKYIVAQDDEGILIIDQHTAWERINYERLKSEFKEKEINSQGALIPEVIELEPSRADELLDKIDFLKRMHQEHLREIVEREK